MIYLRLAAATAVSLLLLGCAQPQPSKDEIWAEIEKCGGQELCSSASVVALTFNKQIGRDFGGGVTLRGAETDGRLLSIGLDVPASIVKEPVKDGRTIKQQIGDIFQTSLCGDKNTKRFLSLGGEIRIRTYLPSGEPFSESSVQSC